MRSADSPPPEDFSELGADAQADVYGILSDLDLLEELLEDLDEFGYTSRDAVELALAAAIAGAGDRQADARASRLEDILSALDDFEVASRDDIVSKMAEIESQAEMFEAGEATSEF